MNLILKTTRDISEVPLTTSLDALLEDRQHANNTSNGPQVDRQILLGMWQTRPPASTQNFSIKLHKNRVYDL